MFRKRLVEKLREKEVRYALAGGYAVSLHGVVRATVDIDLLVSLEEGDLASLVEALSELGLVSRLPITPKEIARFRKDYMKTKNLFAWSFVNPNAPVELVNVLLTQGLREVKVKQVKTAFGQLAVVAIPDLIKMKKKPARPQDLADIEALKTKDS